MLTKFNLDQDVTSIRLGPLMTGKIVGIYTGQYQDFEYTFRDIKVPAWDHVYPQWREKHVYIVQFDQPVRPIAYEEFLEDQPDTLYAHVEYEKQISVSPMAKYPEDDLEIFDIS